MLLARSDFRNIVHISSSPTAELEWYTVHAEHGPILLGSIYRPPNSSGVQVLDALRDEWRQHEANSVGSIIIGDFNLHHRKWLRFSSRNTEEGEKLQGNAEGFEAISDLR